MGNELVTDEHRKRIKEFQSLYYALNARPDTITKLYTNKVIYVFQIMRILNKKG